MLVHYGLFTVHSFTGLGIVLPYLLKLIKVSCGIHSFTQLSISVNVVLQFGVSFSFLALTFCLRVITCFNQQALAQGVFKGPCGGLVAGLVAAINALADSYSPKLLAANM